MFVRKIFAGHIDSASGGGDGTIKLPPIKGGTMCKVVLYEVRVLASSGANVRITVEVWCSPDGQHPWSHSTAISLGDPTTTLPNTIAGNADMSKVLGEYIHCVLKIRDSAQATAQWALVEVYETRKPF